MANYDHRKRNAGKASQMSTLTINSRKLGREYTFYMPPSGGYVRLENGSNHGTLGTQICYGGGFRGNTIPCATDAEFREECRRWYRQHMSDADIYC